MIAPFVVLHTIINNGKYNFNTRIKGYSFSQKHLKMNYLLFLFLLISGPIRHSLGAPLKSNGLVRGKDALCKADSLNWVQERKRAQDFRPMLGLVYYLVWLMDKKRGKKRAKLEVYEAYASHPFALTGNRRNSLDYKITTLQLNNNFLSQSISKRCPS